jgi:NitT/TauT family transport system substrate-binding protein
MLSSCAKTSETSSSATSAGGVREIKFSHGQGLCNMPLFYSAEKDLFKQYGLKGTVFLSTSGGDQATQLAVGDVDMGVIPYTNGLAAYTRDGGFQVVAGSGLRGLIVVAKPEIKTFDDLKGKKFGTFQADTLEMLAYDYLKKNKLTYKDVEMVYFGDNVEALNAFLVGQVDAVTLIEPYATKGLTESKGNRLGDGTDLYGATFPDCVLAARKELIEKEPETVKNVIRTFFQAEHLIESSFEEAAKTTIDKYYKTDMASLLAAAKAQPPGVDIRNQKQFMFARAKSMKELNYINKDPDEGFVNFSLLEAVIKESPDLWQKVKVKSA